MTAEELTQLHQEYREAVEIARHPESDEQAETAAAAMIDLRHKLDEALIEDKAEREDVARMEAVEARARAAKIIAGAEQPKASAFPVEEIRKWASDPGASKFTFNVPHAEQRTDMTTDDTTGYLGAYGIVPTFQAGIRMFEVAHSGVMAAGPTIINTPTDNPIYIQTLTTDMTATHHNEGEASTVTNPVTGRATLNSYRMDGHVALSDELLRSLSNLEEHLSELAGRSLGVKLATYLGDEDIGTGSDLPNAITVGSTAGVTAAGSDTVTASEMKELMYSVLPAYRARGSWICNSDITLEMALMLDDTGNFLWNPSVKAGEPDMLWGRPFFEDAYFDASASGGKVVVFGDIARAFTVRFAKGIEVSFSRDFAFTSFETTMRFALWADSCTTDTLAAKHLVLT